MKLEMMETANNTEGKMALNRWLFNPFYYIAGFKALVFGIISILVTGILAYQGGFHFNGVLDIHYAPTSSYWLSVSELAVSWLLMGALLFITGKVISKSHIRMIDVFGTQALARIPDMFIALAAMIPGSRRFAVTLANSIFQSQGKPPSIPFSMDMVAFIITMIIFFAMTIWMVALMYRAFATSCNVAGKKAAVCFTIALVVGEIISIIIMPQLPTTLL